MSCHDFLEVGKHGLCSDMVISTARSDQSCLSLITMLHQQWCITTFWLLIRICPFFNPATGSGACGLREMLWKVSGSGIPQLPRQGGRGSIPSVVCCTDRLREMWCWTLGLSWLCRSLQPVMQSYRNDHDTFVLRSDEDASDSGTLIYGYRPLPQISSRFERSWDVCVVLG